MNILTLSGVDVGSPRRPGSTLISETRVDVVAGGADIWGQRDEFHFSCSLVSGDWELSLCLESLSMADVYTKAGLMFRTTLADDAEHAMLLAFGDNQPRNQNNGGVEFQSRTKPQGPCTGIYPPQPLPPQPDFPVSFPLVWLKLQRHGSTFTGLFSQDGAAWKTYCTHHQSLPAAGYLGLAVTSHNVERTVRASFSHLRYQVRN